MPDVQSEEFIQNYILEDGGRAVLRRTDPEYISDLRDEVTTWFDEVKGSVKCQNEEDLCTATFNKPTKPVLAGFLKEVCAILRKQNDMISDLCVCNDFLKTELIASQTSVINLQSKLLNSKNEQLLSIQTTVQNTVQEGIRSYNDVVSEKTPTPVFTQDTLRKAFQGVVEEEDRSRNLMLFGVEETPAEGDITDKVSEVFQQLGMKPRMEATRVGQGAAGKCRAVKVTFTSSTIARQILIKAKNLRRVEQHKHVFISPDRSPEQRAAHRELVLELKRRAAAEPKMRYFIRGGKVCSAAKTVGT
jgi:hypothetical protein